MTKPIFKSRVEQVLLEFSEIDNYYDQFCHWKANITPNILTISAASKYWNMPQELLYRGRYELSDLGYAPEYIHNFGFKFWYNDPEIVYQVVCEEIEAKHLPRLIDSLESQIQFNSKLGLSSRRSVFEKELSKCSEQLKVELEIADVSSILGGEYLTKILYSNYYRPILLQRLMDLDNSEISLDIPKIDSENQISKSGMPVFKNSEIDNIYSAIENFFDSHQKADLRRLIEGISEPAEKLMFNDSGNRLAFSMKLLREADIVTACSKKELASWIMKNFNYKSKGISKKFTPDYLEKLISRNSNSACKNPLFRVNRFNQFDGYR